MSDPWSPPDPTNPWQPAADQAPTVAGAVPTAWGAPYLTEETVPFDVVRWLRESTVALLGPFAGMLLVGAPIGLAWARLVGPVPVVARGDEFEFAAQEGTSFFAFDGWFAVVSLVAGMLTGLVAWALLRRRGPAVPIGLAAGGLLGAQIAREVGGRVVLDPRVHAFCTRPGNACGYYDGTPGLRATGVLLGLAFAAVLTHLLLTAVWDRGRDTPPAWAGPRADAVPPWPGT